jgi:hypothetical protein
MCKQPTTGFCPYNSSALVKITTTAFSPTNRPPLSSCQPYTAPLLARLSMFILHAPLATVESALSPISTSDGELSHIDPNSDVLRPNKLTNAMRQCMLRLLKELTLKFPCADHPSPDTIPLALCLLFCHCVALASTSQPEHVPKYNYFGTDRPNSARVSPLLGSRLIHVTLVALSVCIAYKFLINESYWVNLQHWMQPLELNSQSALEGGRYFLDTIHYGGWVWQDECKRLKGTFDGLWEELFSKATRPASPAFLLRDWVG